MCEHETLKPIEVILRRGRRNNGEDEPNQGIIYVYMDMP
jgi:hypothetical protein